MFPPLLLNLDQAVAVGVELPPHEAQPVLRRLVRGPVGKGLGISARIAPPQPLDRRALLRLLVPRRRR
jgi:hypothetical protein